MFVMQMHVFCDDCQQDGGAHGVRVQLRSINNGKADVVVRDPEDAKPEGWVLVKKIDSTSCYCHDCAVKNGHKIAG